MTTQLIINAENQADFDLLSKIFHLLSEKKAPVAATPVAATPVAATPVAATPVAATPVAAGITIDMVRQEVKISNAADPGINRPLNEALLKKYNATAVSNLKPEYYEAVYNELIARKNG